MPCLWESVAKGRYISTFTGPGVKGSMVIVVTGVPRCLMKSSCPLKLFNKMAGTPPNGSTASIFVSTGKEPLIRWFSSAGIEYKVCGHGNQGAAQVWLTLNKEQSVILHAPLQPNPMTAYFDKDWGIVQELNAYAPTVVEAPKLPPLMLEGLGLSASDLKCPTKNDIGYVLYVYQEKTVAGLNPDFEKLKQVGERNYVVAAMTASGVVFRTFCPVLGINEDQVTGSACVNQALVYCMLNKTYGKWTSAKQLSQSGGVLNFQVPKEGETKALLAGFAVDLSDST